MFADLKKKIHKDGGSIPVISEIAATNGSSSIPGKAQRDSSEGLPRSNSMESLDSTSQSDTTKSSRVKKLEGKITELAAMIRDKNAKLEELQKAADRDKEEHVQTIQRIKQSGVHELQSIMEDHRSKIVSYLKRESPLDSKEKSYFENRLRETEREISILKDKAFQRDQESEEVSIFTKQELAKLKHMLINMENEVQSSRGEVERTTTELEAAQRDLDKVRRELEMKQLSLDRIREEKNKEAEERRSHQITIKGLLNDKDNLENQLADMTAQYNKTCCTLSNVERSCADVHDRFQQLSREHDSLKIRLVKVETSHKEKEADLSDRVKTLEARLTDGTEELSVDEKVIKISQERDQLEEKLSHLKTHLTEVKSSWSDRISTLELQIANLNVKISEDAEELSHMQVSKQEMQTGFERQIEESRCERKRLEEQVVALDTQLSNRDSQTDIEKAQWEADATELKASCQALQGQLDTLQQERSDVKRSLHDSQLTLDQTQSKLKEMTSSVNKLEKELTVTKNQLEFSTNQVTELEKERFSRDLKITELKSEVSKRENDIEDLQRKLDQLRQDLKESGQNLKVLKNDKRSLESTISTLECRLKDQHLDTESRFASLVIEVETKTRELENTKKIEQDLLEKVALLDSEKETVVVSIETAEIKRLREEITNLQQQVTEKNKMIKTQKQRLVDLKKTLERELKVQHLPNESNISPSSSASAFISPNYGNQSSYPSSFSPAGQVDTNSRSPPKKPSQSETSTNNKESPSFPNVLDNTGAVVLDSVNFSYLKHVVVKFLLSREVEALQLIRALCTLLRLTSDEENLIRQSLEYRKSWFGSGVAIQSTNMATGQHAKIIPPS